MKNTGIDIAREIRERDPVKDWRFGATSLPCIATIPIGVRDTYLPVGELQYGTEDFMDCATRSPLNTWEAKFTWLLRERKLLPTNEQFLRQKGYVVGERVVFSDRFVAMNSNTDRGGNSLKAPLEAARTQGLIPKKLLPAKADMDFDAYHNKKDITAAMIDLGKEFTQRFKLNYEQVTHALIAKVEETDGVGVALAAWPEPVNGVYQRIEDDFNHAVWLFKTPRHTVFDNYLDTDGDFVKVLAADYKLYEYGYRAFISAQIDYDKAVQETVSFIAYLKMFLANLLAKAARIGQALWTESQHYDD